MSTVYNNMDRPWSFISTGWANGFTLKPREFRTLNSDEMKELKANEGIKKMVDSGLLILNQPKDPVMIDTVAETMKKGKQDLEQDMPIPETNIKVKTEIRGKATLEIPADA